MSHVETFSVPNIQDGAYPDSPVHLFSSLQTKFLDDSVTWNFLAKRELDAPGVGEELRTAMGRALEVDRREAQCCRVYEKGLERINTGKSPHIHKL